MSHYVCKGSCHGVSEETGATCQTEDCQNYEVEMSPCNCTDNSHAEVLDEEAEE